MHPFYFQYQLQSYNLIMIKIFTNILRNFSTLRIPQKYKQAHQITYGLRSCFSIKTLKEYMEKEKQHILLYGKTETLQFLNQYPLNFNNQEIYYLLFALNFQNLNIYEELLRFGCIIRMHQYFPKDPYKFLEFVKKQQDRFVERLKDKQIDGVDGINIIVQKSYFARDQLLNKALETIFNNDMTNYKNMISKCISIILKRIQDINWCQLRKYRSFLSFLCYNYNSNHQDTKNLVQVFTRALALQLHMLGYDSIPIFIDPIVQKIVAESESLDFVSIQNAIQGFKLLPRDYDYKCYKILLNQIKKRIGKSVLYPQKLPLEKMTLAEINQIRLEYLQSSLNLMNCIFYFSNPKSFFFIFDEHFMQKSYTYFVNIITEYDKKVIKADYPAILAFATKLFNFYYFDQTKVQTIKKLTRKMTDKVIRFNLLEPILSEMSICNLMNLKTLQKQFEVFKNDNERISAIIESTIKKSQNKQKNKTYFKSKAFISQIEQLLGHHANTNDLEIKQTIVRLIKSNYFDQINKITSFDTDYISHLAFTFQNSTNYVFFNSLIDWVYQLYKSDIIALAQLFLIFPHKTQRLAIRVINKIWKKTSDFVSIGKIIAYQWENIITKEKKLDDSVLRIINECAAYLDKQKVSDFSEGELQKLLKMCSYLGVQIKSFSTKFINETLERITSTNKEKKSNITLTKQYLKVVNKLDIKLQEGQQKIKTLMNKIQQQTKKQILSLEVYQLLLLSQKYFKNKKGYSVQLKQQIQNQINKKLFTFGNKRAMLPLAFNLFLTRKLQLNQSGIQYLKQFIYKSLLNKQVFPFHLKESIWADLQNKKDFTSKQNQLLKDTILYCLKQVKVQQGASFYYWCLQLSQKLITLQGQDNKCREIINESLELIPLFSIDSSLLNKTIDILKIFPHIINQSFNNRIINILKIPNLNLVDSYFQILQYFNLIYYELPNDINPFMKQFSSKIQKILLNTWEQILQNTKVLSLNDKIQEFATSSYIFLCFAIKNDTFSLNTSQIFDNFMKIYKKYELKAIKKENINVNEVALVNIFLNMELKSSKNNLQKLQKADKKPKFFSKASSIKQKEQVQKNKKLKIQTVFREENKEILSVMAQQFSKLNIKKSQKYLNNEDFYSFNFDYQSGLKVFLFLKYKGKNYTIITKNRNLLNKLGMLGEHKLYQILYKRIFNLQTLYLDPTQIQKCLAQIQQK